MEDVLPVVMMELASQILEVDSARMRERNALKTLSVAEAHAGALEMHPCYVPAIHGEALELDINQIIIIKLSLSLYKTVHEMI